MRLMLEDYENPVGTRGECNYTQEELDELVKPPTTLVMTFRFMLSATRRTIWCFPLRSSAHYDPVVERAPLLLRSCHVGVRHFYRACGQDSLCNSHPAGVGFENFVNFWRAALGKERANRVCSRSKDMMDAGLIVGWRNRCAGVPVNPFYGAECAVTRQAVGRDDVTLGADPGDLCVPGGGGW